jgi:probable HAF family extracellular repeat protein
MNSRSLAWITKIMLFAVLVLPVPLAGQQIRYKIVDLGTFEGPDSAFPGPKPVAADVNDRGVAAGLAALPIPDPFCMFDCFLAHAFKWQNGMKTDLGTLPGGNFSAAGWITANGLVIGGSTNGLMDPILGIPENHGVLWTEDNQIMDLGTLGGGLSFPNDVNNLNQIVGFSTNTTPDPFSFPGVQVRAFLWENGGIRDLGTLGGGPAAAALFINNHGQIAGFSYISPTPNPSTGIPTLHPVLWENGTIKDLGSLGGLGSIATTFNANEGYTVEINGMNERGEIVGTSPLEGDQMHHAFLWNGSLMDLGTLGGDNSQGWWVSNSGLVVGRADFSPESTAHHAFLWKNGVMTDLGTLGPCLNSTAFVVNSKGQVVGDTGDCPGGGGGPSFYSENGQPMVDINTLVLPGSDIEVVDAIYINDKGEIAGGGYLPNGDFHAVLLVPASADEIAAANALNAPQASTHAPIKNLEDSTSRGRGRMLMPNRFLRMHSQP